MTKKEWLVLVMSSVLDVASNQEEIVLGRRLVEKHLEMFRVMAEFSSKKDLRILLNRFIRRLILEYNT